MIEASVLFLTLTDQRGWGFSGKAGIDLNCSTDVDENWYGPMCRVFSHVLRYDLFRSANISGICQVNRDILAMVETYRPKYVIYPCNFSGIVSQSTLLKLRKLGCIVVVYTFDDDSYFETFSRWMIPYADYFVSVMGMVREISAAYERLGARCIISAPIPMNSDLFKKVANCDRVFDATFVGGLHANRRDYLATMLRHGADVKYLGGGHGNKLHFSRVIQFYNQSRINLSFTSGPSLDRSARRMVGRVFEITLCGGFLLTENAAGLEDYFDIGREVESFDTAAEAADKIRYYLRHSDEREQIAERGHRRAMRDHSAQAVLERAFVAIEGDLRQRGRPEVNAPPTEMNLLRIFEAEQYYRWVLALLRGPKNTRTAWRETAELVLETNPNHRGARRLLSVGAVFGETGCYLFNAVSSAFYSLRFRSQSLGGRVKTFLKTHPAVRKPLKIALAPVLLPVRRLYAWRIERFRARHQHQPAPLNLYARLHRRAAFVLHNPEPLMPSLSRLVGPGSQVQDAELAEILRDVELGLWSITADTVDWLTEFLRREQPRTVLEFGSGISTVCLGAALRRIHGADGFRLLSFDQDAGHAEETRKRLSVLGVGASCRVVHVPLVSAVVSEEPTAFYNINEDCDEPLAWLGKAAFVFVDGPSADGPARYGTLTKVRSNLAPGARFALDDGFRPGELLVASLWSQEGIDVEGVLTHGKGLIVGKVP